MYIKPTETLTRKGVDEQHFGTSDVRIHQTGHLLSWKRNVKGSATLEVSSGKPNGEDRWLSIHAAEYAENSSKETFITINEQSAKVIYEYLHGLFGK